MIRVSVRRRGRVASGPIGLVVRRTFLLAAIAVVSCTSAVAQVSTTTTVQTTTTTLATTTTTVATTTTTVPTTTTTVATTTTTMSTTTVLTCPSSTVVTTTSTSTSSTCPPPGPPVCNDGNLCTIDTCDVSGCHHAPATDGIQCNYGSCTGLCEGGSCAA